MLGPSMGLPIVLAPPNDLLGLAITEGIEDGLSVSQATGLGVWAAGAANRMPALAAAVPNYIDCVTIYAHADEAGKRGAFELARALQALGIEVLIEGLLLMKEHPDINDTLREEGVEGVRARHDRASRYKPSNGPRAEQAVSADPI